MKTVLLASLSVLMVVCVGCKSLNNASMTEEMAKRQAVTETLLVKLAEKGSGVVPDMLSSMPESGAVGCTTIERAIRDPSGNVVLNPDGTVAMEKGTAVGKSNSMRELGGLDEAQMVLGGFAFNPKTGEIESGGAVEGLRVYLKGVQVSSGLDSEFATVWAEKTVAEKNAAAAAVKIEYEGRKGLIVEGLTAAGEVAKGVLKEVFKVTPYGAGLAAVQAVVDVAGKDVPITVIEPMKVENAVAK